MVYDEGEEEQNEKHTPTLDPLYPTQTATPHPSPFPKPSSDLYYPPFRSSNDADRVCNDDMVLCVDER